MAQNHVPSDQHPTQGQPHYNTEPATYDHLFSRANQYHNATPSWEQFGQSHSAGLMPQGASQPWQVQTTIPQQQYNPGAQAYGQPPQGYHTQQPSYQYSPYTSQGPQGGYGLPVDPALGQESGAVRAQQQSPYPQALRTTTPQGQPTVSPQVLQQSGLSLQQNVRTVASPYQRAAFSPAASQPASKPNYVIPKGKWSGGFYVIDQAALAKATKSVPVNKFVTLGTEPIHLATNRTALPIYNARQSTKDLKKSGAGSKKLLDRHAQKLKPSSSKMLLAKSAASRLSAGSPSVSQGGETDSDDYTDSSDESDYTDDEYEEVSPLPASRPDEPHAAVRYDVIKTSWLPKNPSPSPDRVKQSLTDLWEVLNTIQKRWRADSKAVTEAEQAKKTGELPVLKSRVASQRDLLQSALKSVLEFSHPNVLWNLGKIKAFLYLCYLFLANRYKENDYNGDLSTVIYQVLAEAAGALSTEWMEETKLSRALNSMKKNVNDANKALIQQITEGAAASSTKPKVSSPPRNDATDAKNGKRPASAPAGPSRPPLDGPAVKKLKPSEPAPALTNKTATIKAEPRPGPTPNTAPQKRPGEKPAAAPVKARGNLVVNKPSGFFSSLNAASKKPTPAPPSANASKASVQHKTTAITVVKDKKTAPASSKPAFSFAATMATLKEAKKEVVVAPKPEKRLPAETPEEKSRRLRKESRRHLRVTFRPDASLVDVRYFNHDPEEEEGHDENFLRDAGDIGGEGRMFKEHRDMVEDEDEEEETDEPQRAWREPIEIDFSMIPSEVHNYAPYGGGKLFPKSPAKEADLRREASVLMVHYAFPSDIPPSPREPVEEPSERTLPVVEFGYPAPDSLILQRSPKPPANPPAVDMDFLESIVRQVSAQNNPTQTPPAQNVYAPPPPAAPPVAPSAPAPSAALTAILSQLGQTNPAQNQQAAFPAFPPMPALPAAPMAGVPDLNALMAQLNQGGAMGALPPAPPLPQWAAQFGPGFPGLQQPPPQAPMDTTGYQHQQQQQSQAQYNQNANGSNGGTKRQRDEGNNSYNNERGQGSSKKAKNKNQPWFGDRPHKVLPCKFFQKGQCNKGDDCTYIHDRS